MDKTFHIDGDYLQEDARESFGRADHWNTESEAEHQSAEEAAHERAKTLARYPLAPGMEWQKTTGIKETEFEVGMCNCAIGQNCPFVAEKWFTTCKVAVPLYRPVAEERTQDELWEDVAVTFGEHEDAREAIKYLQKNYTLAKR